MVIAEVDVDVDVDERDRAVAASLLPDAGPGWSLQDLLDLEMDRTMVAYLSMLDVENLDPLSASVGLTLVERAQAWLAELAVRFTARVAGPPPVPDPDGKDRGPESDDVGARTLVGLRWR